MHRPSCLPADRLTRVQGVQAPMPRRRRRKALPEKIPPMMSPIKSLFGRRTTAGLMLGIPGHASGSLLSSLLLGAPSALSALPPPPSWVAPPAVCNARLRGITGFNFWLA